MSGSGFRRRHRPMSEINVTPLVDVMLVLLIIFMVTAPLLTTGVAVDLPDSAARSLPQDQQPLEVSVTAEGKVFLQDEEVTIEQLIPRLRAIMDVRKNDRVYLRGDQRIAYGRVAEVMGALNAAGFRRVALVTEPPKAN
ncbi:MAG: protein TolR [Alphaproteobacteria bacterium]|nr:MAG: protein TolR [Alphaproteobacteria bacterium]